MTKALPPVPMSAEEWIDGEFLRAMHRAVEGTLTGELAGEPRGLADWKPEQPTPVERALAILDPELRRCQLYEPGPRRLPLL